MTHALFIFSGYLTVINGIGFFLVGRDKADARKGKAERIAEGVFFFLASIGGGIGVFLGMLFFRHKTRKWTFLLGIPLVAGEQAACLYGVYLLVFGGGMW